MAGDGQALRGDAGTGTGRVAPGIGMGDVGRTERPRRIVHVLAPAPYGGLERVVHALALGQQRRGHAVRILAVLGPGETEHPFLRAALAAGLDAEPIEVAGRAYRLERATVAARARAFGAELLHTHGYRPDVVDSPAARKLGIPRVTTVHGFTGGGLRNRLYEVLQRRSFRRFEAVVAVSRPMARRLIAGGVRADRVHVLRNAWAGEAPALSAGEARTALGLPPTGSLLGWVGRLSREKAFDVLLEALPFLGDEHVRACVVGDGRERAALEARAAALGIAERVIWLGAVPEAGRFARAFDLFVLSSRTEGTPISLLEAMAAEVPVVATAVGGVPDVVSPAEAVLVPPESPPALAEGIRAALADPAATRRRAAAALERLGHEFAPRVWLEGYDRVYEEASAQR